MCSDVLQWSPTFLSCFLKSLLLLLLSHSCSEVQCSTCVLFPDWASGQAQINQGITSMFVLMYACACRFMYRVHVLICAYLCVSVGEWACQRLHVCVSERVRVSKIAHVCVVFTASDRCWLFCCGPILLFLCADLCMPLCVCVYMC